MVVYFLLVMVYGCDTLIAMNRSARMTSSAESFMPSTPPITIPLETKSRSLTALPLYYSSPTISTSPLTLLGGKQFPDTPLALIALFKELLREGKIKPLFNILDKKERDEEIKKHVDDFSLSLSPQLKSLYISQAPSESTYPSKLKEIDETKAYKQYWSQKSSKTICTSLSTVEEKLKKLDKALLQYFHRTETPYVQPPQPSDNYLSENANLLPYDFPCTTNSLDIFSLDEELELEIAVEIPKEAKETL